MQQHTTCVAVCGSVIACNEVVCYGVPTTWPHRVTTSASGDGAAGQRWNHTHGSVWSACLAFAQPTISSFRSVYVFHSLCLSQSMSLTVYVSHSLACLSRADHLSPLLCCSFAVLLLCRVAPLHCRSFVVLSSFLFNCIVIAKIWSLNSNAWVLKLEG